MALERNLNAVPPVLVTVDSTDLGTLTIASTCNFFVKQNITLAKAGNVNPITLQIKRVVDYTTLWVDFPGTGMDHTADVSAYTVAAGSYVFAVEQPKAAIPDEIRKLASYMQEPVNAWRGVTVDCNGVPFGGENPFPVAVQGTMTIGDVHILGPSPTNNELVVNPDGSINVNVVAVPVTGQTVKNIYGEANAVASGATTIVVQYTVPMMITNAILERISVSGENIAKFTVFVNATQIDTRRTFYGSSLSEYFEFTTGTANGYTLMPGDVLKVKVLHTRPYVGDFEGRIQVLEIA